MIDDTRAFLSLIGIPLSFRAVNHDLLAGSMTSGIPNNGFNGVFQ